MLDTGTSEEVVTNCDHKIQTNSGAVKNAWYYKFNDSYRENKAMHLFDSWT